MKKKIFSLFIIFILIIVSCFSTPFFTYADDVIVRSDVLEDLELDSSFDKNTYIYNTTYDNYSIKLITIAESEDSELFVYTYQRKPSSDYKQFYATSIRMWDNNATIDSNNGCYIDKPLKFLSYNNDFYKYVVEDFVCPTADIRRYEIVQVEREFNLDFGDEQATLEQTISTVPFGVAKRFVFSRSADYVEQIETISIENKFCGFCRYYSGIGGWSSFFRQQSESVDSHFVAFSSSFPIDKLIDADICYSTRSFDYSYNTYRDWITLGDKSPVEYHNIKESDVVSGNQVGLFNQSYNYSRIQRIKDFFETEDYSNTVYTGLITTVSENRRINEEEKKSLENCQWVLRFLETNYTTSYIDDMVICHSTQACDVSILRLHFMSGDVEYFLGVIDNKQTESLNPSNSISYDIDLNDTGKFLATLIAIVILILIVSKLAPVFKFVVKMLLFPFKTLRNLLLNKRKRKR